MKLKVLLGACAILLSSVTLVAQEKSKKMPEMSAEQKAAMDAMMKAATPGAEHKKLASMVGTWETKVTMWMAPGAPPQVSTGVSTNKSVLGGRYIQESFKGTFMGQPFSGIGYTGYDNVTGQYIGSWMDTASTAMMNSTGKAEDDKTFTFASTMPDPMTKKPMDFKTKVTVTDKNHHVMEMWGPAPDGTTFKMMEITYSRKKS